VTVAASPNAATTCGGSGAVTATAGAGTVSLPATRSIPGGAPGSCTITVDVTSATPGTATNTIAAGALQTSNGNNAAAASATLTVNASVSGTVFNDANGAIDSLVNGSGTDAGSSSLTAYLVNPSGAVVASSDVAVNGAYGFNNVPNGTYSVVLSNTAGVTVGEQAPGASLPPGWVNTSEGVTPAGDGSANGVVPSIVVSNSSVANVNFGIERPPTATNVTAAVQPNPGGTASVAVPVGTFSPVDAEDGSAVGMRVTAFPSNSNSITINGITYTAGTFPSGGVVVPAAGIAGITVDPVDGSVTVNIPYVARDAANQESAPAIAGVPFSAQPADLVIQKNGPAVVPAGGAITYTLTVSNAGPGPAAAVPVADAVPVQVGGLSVVCGAQLGGASCGPVANFGFAGNALNAQIENLPAGGSVSLTINGTVSATASGTFANTATVNAPAGLNDLNPANNTSTVNTTIGVVPATADVSIVKAGTANVQTSGAISYQLTVVNAGPGPANGSVVTDSVPTAITGVTTTCMAAGGAACPAAITPGNALSIVIPTLPSGGQITLMVSGTAPSAPQSITNTASVAVPVGITDPAAGNNTSSAATNVVSTPPQQADLAAIKTGPATVNAGGAIAYTVLIGNNGPAAANAAAFMDNVPSVITSVTTNCTARNGAVCPAVPAGNAINVEIPTLPAGGELTFTISGTAPQSGSFSNSATIAPPAGVNDPVQSNNTGGPVITQILATGISGVVWRDTDRNGLRGAGEALLPGVAVRVLNGSGTEVGSAITDAIGSYLITGLPAGSGYSVVFDFGNLDRGLVVPQNVNAALNGTATNQTTISNVTLQTGTITLDQNARIVDPAGVVYDSVARTPIQGATVTLIGPNGQPVPASQLLVTTPNNQITTATGSYIFLLNNTAPTGTYTIQVTPPAGYLPPNAVLGGVVAPTPVNVPPSPGTLLVQPQAGPPAAGASTTYHFLLNNFGPGAQDVLNNHIPLDRAVGGTLLIEKVANVPEAEIGDVVVYTIRVSSPVTPAVGVTVADRLPPGFIFIPGSVRINEVRSTDPTGTPGPALEFNLGNLTQGGSATLTYRVRLGVGSAEGDGVNRAQARAASGGQSAVATAKIRVKRGVFTKDACVIGKVFVDCNGNSIQDREELGIPGVRLLFTDGTYVVSDVEGKYSYCGLPPKTHGLKVDPLTLPKGSRLTTSSNRNALDPNSLFIDLKAGELHRADFIEGSCSDEVLRQVKARRAKGEPGAAEREAQNDSPLIFRSRDGLLEGNQNAPIQRSGNPASKQSEERPLPRIELPGLEGR
jgi:large repetitive protein